MGRSQQKAQNADNWQQVFELGHALHRAPHSLGGLYFPLNVFR